MYSVVGKFLVGQSAFVLCGRELSCWTLTVTVYSVTGNGLLDTVGDCVQCNRKWSCWILTVTLCMEWFVGH